MLLSDRSKIYKWNTPGSGVVIIAGRGGFAYEELDSAGRQVQTQLLEKYYPFQASISILLKKQLRDTLKKLSQMDALVMRTIEQHHTWNHNIQEVLDEALTALRGQVLLLDRLFDPTGGETCIVPDTNALLHNPDLENWTFPGMDKFTMVLLPTVLAELDGLKIDHRNPSVREKAEKLIRKIKDYRRRERLTAGVVMVKGKSTLQAVALEPDMSESLPWLDPQNQDDRFIASVIEVMRSRPNSPVIAISRDINLQNKAEYTNVPFIDPPEPVAKTKSGGDET